MRRTPEQGKPRPLPPRGGSRMRFRIPRLRPPAFGGEDPQSPLAGAAVLSPLLLDTSTPCPPAGLYGRMDEKNKKLIDLGNSSSGISSVGTLFRGRAIASSTRARGGVTFVLVVVGGGVRDLGCGREMSPRGNHCDEHFGNTHTHTHTHTHDEEKKKEYNRDDWNRTLQDKYRGADKDVRNWGTPRPP